MDRVHGPPFMDWVHGAPPFKQSLFLQYICFVPRKGSARIMSSSCWACSVHCKDTVLNPGQIAHLLKCKQGKKRVVVKKLGALNPTFGLQTPIKYEELRWRMKRICAASVVGWMPKFERCWKEVQLYIVESWRPCQENCNTRLLPKENFREPFGLPKIKVGSLRHNFRSPELISH